MQSEPRYAEGQQRPSREIGGQENAIAVKVIDENRVLLASVRVSLKHLKSFRSFQCRTDWSGRCYFSQLPPGPYRLLAEKEGFYTLTEQLESQPTDTLELEVILNHYRETTDSVDVVYSLPSIDPTQSASTKSLDSEEIVNVPYPTDRDIRTLLPFLPGILLDNNAALHLNGSSSDQILYQMDGFNISHPASGQLDLRFSPEAVRRIRTLGSRYSAEYGKSSAGIVSFESDMGDDHYRVTATNFIPSVQFVDGIDLETWTPRLKISGPVRRGKAWFSEALQGEYNLNIVEELPSEANQNLSWRVSSLSRIQFNLTPSNILTSSLLIHRFRSDHTGLSPFDPLETTIGRHDNAYLFSLRDQVQMGSILLEMGLLLNGFDTDEQPLGDSPYVVHPDNTSGNFYRRVHEKSQRIQLLANLTWPAVRWHGRHAVKIGTDLTRIALNRSFERRPILTTRRDGTLSRETTFTNFPNTDRINWEMAFFVQDHWSVSDRLLLEIGLRFDWDALVRDVLLSPRVASSYLVDPSDKTRLVAGIGLFYDATNLGLISSPFEGSREDRFYDFTGQTPLESVTTRFTVNEDTLKAPRFLNWSFGLERELPASLYLTVEIKERRGQSGLSFAAVPGEHLLPGLRTLGLQNIREDHYRAIQVDLTRRFRNEYQMFASFSRSAARSNAVLTFDLDNLLLAEQASGPLAWDVPDRLISWGWLPFVKGFQLAYALDWRDGFPFNVVNEDQQLIGSPHSQRFPAYFALNLHLQRRFSFLGRDWQLRIGSNNLTDRRNATAVNNNIDSADFLTFGGAQGRALVGRIRLLEKH